MRATSGSRKRAGCLLAGVAAALVVAGCTSTSPTASRPPAGETVTSDPASTAGAPSPTSTGHDTPGPKPATPMSTLAGKVVVLDPGHNGGNADDPQVVNALVPAGDGTMKACDTTGTNAVDGYYEHAFTFDTSERVKNLLQARGIRVIMTRDNDTGVGPCVNVRAAIGNQVKANAAVSIHGDGHDGGHGFQVIEAISSAGGRANDAASHRLALAMHSAFINVGGLVPATYIGVNGYERRSDLAGLNLSTQPKILVECGNMLDPNDAAMMESPSGRERIARAIAAGIEAFLLEQR
jgi:N-acetylmuramoyl-L-alanine amidase